MSSRRLADLRAGTEDCRQARAGLPGNPSVSAEIVTRRPFYVIGEVQKPGNYAYVTDMTALNAVAMAGGFTRRAKKETTSTSSASALTER